jgi:uncharacterized protein YpmB
MSAIEVILVVMILILVLAVVALGLLLYKVMLKLDVNKTMETVEIVQPEKELPPRDYLKELHAKQDAEQVEAKKRRQKQQTELPSQIVKKKLKAISSIYSVENYARKNQN